MFSFTFLLIQQNIVVERSCLRTNAEATLHEGSTYTIICSRNLLAGSLVVLLPAALSPFFFSFILKLLFLRLPSFSFFLRHGLSSAFLTYILSASWLLPPSSFPTLFSYVPPARLRLLSLFLFSLRPQLYHLKFSRTVVSCSKS